MPVSTYRITNKVNGKSYIGITKFPIEKRFKEHLYNATKRSLATYLYNSIRKYGEEVFEISHIASCILDEQASELEKGPKNKSSFSTETRTKMSLAKKGKPAHNKGKTQNQ